MEGKKLTFAYDNAGNLDSVSRYSGVPFQFVDSTDFTYDKANRLTDIAHQFGGEVDAEHHYLYDNASRITTFVTTNDTNCTNEVSIPSPFVKFV